MNKRILGTVLVIAGLASTIQADENATYGLGVNQEPRQLDVSVKDGLTANVLWLSVGGRKSSSDEKNYSKIKAKTAVTGTYNSTVCANFANKIGRLKKNKGTGFIIHAGVRDSQYQDEQSKCVASGCSDSQCNPQ